MLPSDTLRQHARLVELWKAGLGNRPPNRGFCPTCRVNYCERRPNGLTYIAQRERWVKIGWTGKDVTARMQALRKRPRSVRLPLGMDPKADLILMLAWPFDVEHQWHESQREHHAAGEWFTAEPVLDELVRR